MTTMTEPRVEQWKRKLLDLSLRNPLLNVRESAKFLPLVGGVPNGTLEAGATFPLKAALPEKEIRKRLKELYATSRGMFAESGINSLYVAVGFLNWNEKDGEEHHRAPLALIPAQLIRQTAAPRFRLVRTDEDAVVNFCLVELLRSQFGIPVKDVSGGGLGDGDPDFNEVFKVFADAIQDRKEWSLSSDLALGIFSFSKVVIWKNLTDHFNDFERHPFVAHLSSRAGLFDDGVEVFPPEEVEKHVNYEKLFCPLSADASQLTAVLYSELGKSFVLHGPPGTGKSQTITNIIAHNLALGKRVLFVSEKKAALDVVHKRLSAVGLAPFCLELHSNKADKSNVMRQFSEALAVRPGRNAAHWAETCARMTSATAELAEYAKALNAPCRNGLSAFDCISRFVTRHSESKTRLLGFAPSQMTHARLGEIRSSMLKASDEWKSVDKVAFAALCGVCLDGEWSREREDNVRRHAEGLLAALDETNVVKRWLKLIWRGLCAVPRAFEFSLGLSREEQRKFLQGILDHLDGLRLVMAYRAVRQNAVANGCGKFIEAMEEGRFPSDEAARVFDDAVAEKTLDAIVRESPALSRFSGVKQEELIAKFREIDEKYRSSVKSMIFAALSKRMPNPATMSPELKKQMSVLKHECEKKKRFMALRLLLAETRDLVPKLKPCFLMSPLSVAQYLPVGDTMFDLVVFDEASQMTVCDAVGVIARARQFIVVGDPKQLPPTNFFVKGEVTDEMHEGDFAAEDLESILDECIASGLHSAYLNWHYRSRHESLIAFSNRMYYQDRLNTFPAARTNARLGVSFRYVEGALYDHVSHTNRVEAEAIVDFLFEKLASPDERKRSWGVVTFSVAQQKLIEDLIDARSEGCDWAAEFFDDSKPDAFFVKNLENVQGDERDVIIFSIAYAPDAEGRFAMSFGPINRQGGERRLNVAITRAREQVIVFASAHPSDIRVERTNSVGVKHLRALMDYAATGHLDGDVLVDETRERQGLKKVVCDFLMEHGYAFDVDVGRSAYPVGIAVRDPEDPERHVLGIEFDGGDYAAQRTVRDRDVLRSDVLKDLGWNVHRVWSIDWAFDRKRAEQRILDALPKKRDRLQIENESLD